MNYRVNRVDFLTSGLFAATRINTVSPTFLREIAQNAFSGYALIPEPVRRTVASRFKEEAASGILNAPMPTADPRVDPMIHRKYDARSLVRGKQNNKLHFQDQMKLQAEPKAPLFFWPHRLASPQKGVELMLAAIPFIMTASPTAQFAVVANGQMDHVYGCQRLMNAFPGRVAYHSFSRELSQLGKAGADFILSPSHYEPCGIPQVEGPRYGTLPIVRKTGGLADTVEPLTETTGNGLSSGSTRSRVWSGRFARRSCLRKPLRTRARVLRRIMIESFLSSTSGNRDRCQALREISARG
jgi:glycogen synthase